MDILINNFSFHFKEVSYQNSLTETLLGWFCLGNFFKESNQSFYTPKNKFFYQFLKHTKHGDRVCCLNRKFVSSSISEIVRIIEKLFGFDLEISEEIEKFFGFITKVRTIFVDKVKSQFSDYRRINKDCFEKYISKKLANLPISKTLQQIDKADLLASSNSNSLYPIHKDSEWPEIKATQAIKQEDSNRLCELLNTGEWKNLNKSRFCKMKIYNPRDIVFQHMAVKEKVSNDRKNRYQEINRFRRGFITQNFAFVDIEELVRVGCYYTIFFCRFHLC